MSTKSKSNASKNVELSVFCDTSIIFDQKQRRLLNGSLVSLLHRFKDIHEPRLNWILAKMTVDEREYRLVEEGLKLLNSAKELEKLLRHDLQIDREKVIELVRKVIASEINEHGFEIASLDYSKVDWVNIVHCAVNGVAPFERSKDCDKEKGFRDAIIGETFYQLIRSFQPKSKKDLLCFLAGDKRLGDAVTTKSEGFDFVRVFRSLDELESFVNARVSEVTEGLMKTLADKADRYFYAPLDIDSLFFKKDIKTRIKNKCSDLDFPPGHMPIYLDLKVNTPRFQKQEGDKVFWVSRIDQGVGTRINALLANSGYSGPTQPNALAGYSGIAGYKNIVLTEPNALAGYYVPTVPNIRVPDDVIAEATHNRSTGNFFFMGPRLDYLSKEGTISFDVTWSVHVNQKTLEFSDPQIISVEHVETTWE